MTGDFKVGVIATVYFPFSHADVIVSRWLEPMHTDAAHGWVPRTRIASLYVAQVPPTDLSDVPEADICVIDEWAKSYAILIARSYARVHLQDLSRRPSPSLPMLRQPIASQ